MQRVRRPVVVGAAALVALGLLAATVWWWPTSKPKPRAREYRDVTACLLTDERGLAGEQAQAVWAGMQKVSLAHLVKVQYLAVTGPQTAANARTYFNSLGLQRCEAIVAVGEIPVAAVIEGRERFPGARYVLVGQRLDDPRVTSVPDGPAEGVAAGVEAALVRILPSPGEGR